MKNSGDNSSEQIHIIAVDCGNSRVKLSDGHVTLGVDATRIGTSVQSFFEHRPHHILSWSSVSPEAWKRIRTAAGKRVMIDAMNHVYTHSPLRRVLSEGTGHDRILGCVGALMLLSSPQSCITIDCGTATTINAVNARAEFMGGMILPGLALMTKTLHEHTAQLPSTEIDEPVERRELQLGRTTVAAIRSGALHATVGGIVGAVNEVRKKLRNPDIPVFLTGGNADVILSVLKKEINVRHVHDLVLSAIRGIAENVMRDAQREKR